MIDRRKESYNEHTQQRGHWPRAGLSPGRMKQPLNPYRKGNMTIEERRITTHGIMLDVRGKSRARSSTKKNAYYGCKGRERPITVKGD